MVTSLDEVLLSSRAPRTWSQVKDFWAADQAVNDERISRVTLRLFRMGQWLERDRRPALRPVRKLWWAAYHSWCTALGDIELSPLTEVGPALRLRHSGRGVVIHPHVQIGHHAIVFHGVTIGVRAAGESAVPVIGNYVRLSAGCVLLGGISVGDGAVVGANAVVAEDVPAESSVVPAKARILLRRTTDPA